MKKFKVLGLFLLITISLCAQYRSFKIQKINFPEAKIVQIDFREFSTLVHMRFVNNSAIGNVIYCDDNFFIKDNNTNKKYKLLNSFNLPLGSSNKRAVIEEKNQTLNFTLEFEKLPDSADNLDLIENLAGLGFNFLGVKINKQIKENDFLDITSFTEETPLKEMDCYYKDGALVQCYQKNGLKIAFSLAIDVTYGKYFQSNILIQNLSGKNINFDPNNITARIHSKEGIAAKVLTYGEYMKKVNNRQNWNAFFVAYNQSTAASKAGYSSSSTRSSVVGSANSFGSAYGYNGNSYSSVYGSTYSYGSAYGTSQTKKFNGAESYAAKQNASNNIANYQNQQYQIKNSLSEGYMKQNTLMNETEYIGYVNIAYKKTDRIIIDISINGESYVFIYNI